MNFIAPLALALSALAIPIIMLYMLRLRRREVQVSSTFLWQQILRDREANAPWQKLRRNLLLLLQLLILLAIVFALARPYVEVPTVTTGRVALLIDASASMTATDEQPTRFELAKQRANEILDTRSQTDQVALIRVAAVPEMVQSYGNDWVQLRQALNAMQVSRTSADWNAALTLAAAGAAGADKFTIIVIGDGGLPADLASYGEVRFIPVGRADSNVGISALAPANDPARGPQIYTRLTNYGAQDAEVILSIYLDGKLNNALPYTVKANSATDAITTDLPADFAQIRAEITRPANSTVPDYLALDDVAWAVYNAEKPSKAILFSAGNRYLEQGLTTLPAWKVTRGNLDTGLPTDPTEQYDLYVFDGWLPPELPQANMLILNPPTDTALFKLGAVKLAPTKLTTLKDDDRTRYLSFSDVNIRQYRPILDAAWADALVSNEGESVIAAGTSEGRRIAVLGFALRDSDFPLKIAYPILLANLTSWYKSPRAVQFDGSLQPGQALTLQPLPESTTIRVTRPDQAVTTLTVNKPLLLYADTPLAGIYTVDVYRKEVLAQTERFAVNLFDAAESTIAPRTPTFTGVQQQAQTQGEIGQRELWGWIALAALAVLALEWWVYHRRLALPTLGTSLGAGVRRFARKAG